MIRFRSVSFTYLGRQTPSLSEIDLYVHPGQVLLLAGCTGSGKSTLLRTINGLIPHATSGTLRGEVYVDGTVVASVPVHQHCRKVGSVYQNPYDQVLHTYVEDEIAFALQNLGFHREMIDRRIDEALEWVGLSGFRDRSIQELSGGQQQRVVLAAACAPLPHVLLLDEPVSQLDPAGAYAFLTTTRELRRRHPLTTLFVDHRTESVMDFAERVVILTNGTKSEDLVWNEVCSNAGLLARRGVETGDLLDIAEKFGCREPIRRADDLVRWIKSSGRCLRRNTRPHPGIDSSIGRGREGLPGVGIWGANGTHRRELGGRLVACDGVSYRYSQRYPPALRDISLTLRQGESVAVIGENGSGKSTLLLMLAGVLRPQEGAIERPTSLQSPTTATAIVPQNCDLMLQAETVAEEIAFGLKCRGQTEAHVRREVARAVRLFRLEEFANDPPFALSQGERQRVAIAAAFALRPQTLLLDEPTTGQDRRHIDLCMTALTEHHVADGGCLVFCTHDLRTAAEYADRIVVLKEGRILADGPTIETLSREEVLLSTGHFLPPIAQVSRALGGPITLTARQFMAEFVWG